MKMAKWTSTRMRRTTIYTSICAGARTSWRFIAYSPFIHGYWLKVMLVLLSVSRCVTSRTSASISSTVTLLLQKVQQARKRTVNQLNHRLLTRTKNETIFIGVYLHSLVLTAFHNGGGITKMKYFAPFGWLLPLVITITWVVVNQFFRDKNAVCWDSNLSKPIKFVRVYNHTPFQSDPGIVGLAGSMIYLRNCCCWWRPCSSSPYCAYFGRSCPRRSGWRRWRRMRRNEMTVSLLTSVWVAFEYCECVWAHVFPKIMH